MRKLLSRTNLSATLLFFCLSFALFFFICTSTEYNYNQKIDRGFLSVQAKYFSTTEATESSASVATEQEKLLGLVKTGNSKDSYFLCVQAALVRAAYFQGNIEVPPVTSGRFFSHEESLSDKPLAVVGSNHISEIWVDSQTNLQMITVLGNNYQVIGVVGFQVETTLDDLIYVNLGSLSLEQVCDARMYIDASANQINEICQKITDNASQNLGITMSEIDMPKAATDVVSGGVIMSDILAPTVLIFLFLTYLCTLVLLLRSERQKISTLLLLGFSPGISTLQVIRPQLVFGTAGVLLSVITGWVLAYFGVFHLPVQTEITYAFLCGGIGLILLLGWLFPLYYSVSHFSLPESMR